MKNLNLLYRYRIILFFAQITLLLGAILLFSPVTSAQRWTCPDGTVVQGPYRNLDEACQADPQRGGGMFAPSPTSDQGTEEFRVEPDCEDLGNCGIIDTLIGFINILSAAVGVIIVIIIAVGGVQYSMARDNPQAVAAARQRIINALLALVVFMGMAAFLQWLVPGGIFSP